MTLGPETMGFDVGADAYGQFMGRYSEPLADAFVEWAEVRGDALDVSCGAGALTSRLADRLGPQRVCGIDPSKSFVAATRDRCPGADIRQGAAERLPFGDQTVGTAGSALHGRSSGRIAGDGTCDTWDRGGDCLGLRRSGGPLSVFWSTVREVDPTSDGEGERAGTREGHLAELFTADGLTQLRTTALTVSWIPEVRRVVAPAHAWGWVRR
jgi:SAM-dependent methyltransferase